MRKYITLFALVTAFVFVFGANFGMAADKVINWKMQCAYPPGDNSYDIHSM
jgi:hypothetical protein